MKAKSLSLICTFLLFIGFLKATQAQEFWGLTSQGGVNNTGVIFEWGVGNPGFFNTNYDFDVATVSPTNLGKNPEGSLMIASNGNLYGMTSGGGVNGLGVLFEYNPATFTYTKKVDFSQTLGSRPLGRLVEGVNNKLYGMTSTSGSGNIGPGVIFEYDISNNNYTVKINFTGVVGGGSLGSLILASNSKLYGLTEEGGNAGLGTLFEYDPSTNTFTSEIEFENANGKGYRPYGSLMQASNGKLYGMTFVGGTNQKGVIFEYDINTNTLTKLYDFSDGKNPQGDLIQAKNGKLYGMTRFGGANDLGILFEYDVTTNTFTKKFDFDGANHGSEPRGSLLQASNNKFYGTTMLGGLNGLGTLFEYDLATNTLTKKQDMGSNGTGTTVTGYYPKGNLIERSTSILDVSEVEKQFGFSLYPNPSNSVVKLQYKNNLNISTIRLFNILGSLVKEFKTSQTDLDISKLPTGVYVLKVNTNKGIISKKILKK